MARGGSRDRFSSSVTDEENGLSQFQLVYHDDSSLVLFFWTGGGCAACRKGLRILGERVFGNFGRDILWSINLPNEGSVGIEFGSVNTNVITENIAIVPSSTTIRLGFKAGTGRPNRVRWTGILAKESQSRRQVWEIRSPS